MLLKHHSLRVCENVSARFLINCYNYKALRLQNVKLVRFGEASLQKHIIVHFYFVIEYSQLAEWNKTTRRNPENQRHPFPVCSLEGYILHACYSER